MVLAPAPLPLICSMPDRCTHAKQPWYAVQRLAVAVQQQSANPKPEAVLTAIDPGCALLDKSGVWCSSYSTSSNSRDTIAYALELLSSGSHASPEPMLFSSASISAGGSVTEGAAEVMCDLAEMPTPPMTPGRQLRCDSCPQAPSRRGPSVVLVPASEMSRFLRLS